MTDNDSAKMATGKGVIQGYTAVAAVDAKAQVIVAAQAHGSGSEQSTLLPMVSRTAQVRDDRTMITADAGYHSEANLRELCDRQIPALIADGLMRRRDSRLAGQARYKELPDPLYDKGAAGKRRPKLFRVMDFDYDAATNSCTCWRASSSIQAAASARPTADAIASSRERSATAYLRVARAMPAAPATYIRAPVRHLRACAIGAALH
jgi:hypothetical protein